MSTASRAGSAMYVVVSWYPCALLVDVIVQVMPVGSVFTVYVVSRDCRSVNVVPSVTTYCSDLTFVLSIVGS